MAGRIPLFLLACGSFNPITHQHMRLFELARDQMHQTGLYHVVGGIVSPVSDSYGKTGLVASKHRLAMARLALQSSDWVTVDEWESQQSDWTETLVTMRYHFNRIAAKYQRKTGELKDPPTNSSGKPHPHLTTSTYRKHSGIFLHIVDFIGPQQFTAVVSNSRPAGHLRPALPFSAACGPQLKLLCGADFMDNFKVPGLWRADHIEEVVGRFGLVCVTRGSLEPDRTIHESDMLSRHRQNIFLVREWIQNEISATEVRRALRRGYSVKYLLPDSVIAYIKENNLYT